MTITIGKALPRATNVIILHLKAMSGDAQAYQTSTRDFANTPEGQNELRDALRIIRVASKWDVWSDDEAIEEAIHAYAGSLEGCTMSADEAVEWYRDFVGRDVTTEGRRARLDRAWVTYVDEQGLEFEVMVDLDGEQVSTFGISR